MTYGYYDIKIGGAKVFVNLSNMERSDDVMLYAIHISG